MTEEQLEEIEAKVERGELTPEEARGLVAEVRESRKQLNKLHRVKRGFVTLDPAMDARAVHVLNNALS